MTKFNLKTFFVMFTIFSFVNIGYIISVDPADDFLDPEIAQEIFDSMKLEKEDRMNRKEFKEYFYKLLTKNLGKNHPQASFFQMVTDKFCKNLPKEIRLEKISEVVTQEKLYKAIQEVVAQEYGAEYLSKLDETYKEIEKEAESIDDDEAIKYYEQSKKESGASKDSGKTKTSTEKNYQPSYKKDNNKDEHIEL
jgi:hypothetical protein